MSSKIIIDNVSGSITSDGVPITGGGGGGSAATEGVTVVNSALNGSVNIDTSTNRVHYYTVNATANWTPNIRSSSSATLDSAMSIGDAMTVTILAKIGSSGYFSSSVQIDGSSIVPQWAGGIVPTAGNSNGTDIYSYSIIKTASATFSVFASIAQYA
jgi:hypothetical protein